MTDAEVDGIISAVWRSEASLSVNLRALVRAAAVYGWRCAQAAHWLIDMVDPIEEQKRQDRLESWYEQDGRNEKDHPLHSLYTGLAEKYMNKENANV